MFSVRSVVHLVSFSSDSCTLVGYTQIPSLGHEEVWLEAIADAWAERRGCSNEGSYSSKYLSAELQRLAREEVEKMANVQFDSTPVQRFGNGTMLFRLVVFKVLTLSLDFTTLLCVRSFLFALLSSADSLVPKNCSVPACCVSHMHQ